MVAITKILLFAISVAASVIPRDAASTKADLATINTDYNTLTTALNNYTGNKQNLQPAYDAAIKLNDDIKAATNRANAQATLSASDAKTAIAYLKSPLEPSAKKTITAFQNKKAQFTADGFKGTILQALQTLKTSTQNHAVAFVKTTPSASKSAAQAAFNTIIADIDAGITTYSS